MRIRDWSSDVCSSDLGTHVVVVGGAGLVHVEGRRVVGAGQVGEGLVEAVGLDRPAAVGERAGAGDHVDVGRAGPLAEGPALRRPGAVPDVVAPVVGEAQRVARPRATGTGATTPAR